MKSKNRISFDLGSPVRILGQTLDELGLLGAGFVSFFVCSNKVFGSLLTAIFVGSFLLLKRLKKTTAGFNIKGFLWWHLGRSRTDRVLPPSHTRRIG